MDLFDQIELLKQIDFHIEHKSTGCPQDFASRLHMSQRTLYRLLEQLKDRNVHMEYIRAKGSYVYLDDKTIPKLIEDYLKGRQN